MAKLAIPQLIGLASNAGFSGEDLEEIDESELPTEEDYEVDEVDE